MADKIRRRFSKVAHTTGLLHHQGQMFTLVNLKIEAFKESWDEIMKEGGVEKDRRQKVLDSLDYKYLKQISSYKMKTDQIKPIGGNKSEMNETELKRREEYKKQEYKNLYKRQLSKLLDMRGIQDQDEEGRVHVVDFFPSASRH